MILSTEMQTHLNIHSPKYTFTEFPEPLYKVGDELGQVMSQ